MGAGHNFNFEGGEILAGMAAWWFVSYAYYNYIDRDHFDWQVVSTYKSRRSKYNNSTEYHRIWLEYVLKMEQLDKIKNSANLSGVQIKEMAKKVLGKLQD